MMCDREMIEWSNTWREAANNPDIDRVVMLGDSVTRGIRGKLNEICMKDNCVVDLCASSSQITDTMTEKQIRFFMNQSEYRYKLVFFQWGGQHGFNTLCCEDDSYKVKYKRCLCHIVDVVMEYCDNIVFLPATPTMYKEDLNTYNVERNKEIVVRNDILRQVADEYAMKYIDIYTLCMKPYMVHTDYIHFNSDSNKRIAEVVYDGCF